MNIGILTYHAACNFGANLQALSTFEYFKNNGHNPIFIDWMTEELRVHYEKTTQLEQYLEHKKYREKYFKMTSPCTTDQDIAEAVINNNIDAVIIGSDAVMQHHTFLSRIVFPSRKIVSIMKIGADRMCPNPFWGSFIRLLPKRIPIAYMSASSQNSVFNLMTKRERLMASELLSNFSYISTRDEWSSKMVSWITKGQIIPAVTPDPVFAFNYNVKEQPSEEYIRHKFGINGKYFLLSFHNSKTVSIEWLKKLEEIANKAGIECVALAFPNGINFNNPFKHKVDIPLSPIEWFSLIKYSNGYIGHNMHPIVVCLHNSVPCFSFDNYGVVKLKLFVNEESSKIYHIMKTFGVLDNRVSCISKHYKAPDPQHVFNKLISFNRDYVKKCSEIYLNEYLKMMQNILKSFVK